MLNNDVMFGGQKWCLSDVMGEAAKQGVPYIVVGQQRKPQLPDARLLAKDELDALIEKRVSIQDGRRVVVVETKAVTGLYDMAYRI
jgi:hypothetical protein